MQHKVLWELRRIHLEDWTYSMVKRFKEQASNQKQTLLFKISGALPLFAFDRSSLELILIGLVNNACKHTLPKEKIAISLSAKFREGRPASEQLAQESKQLWLQLRVSYSGSEAPASELLPVLDSFYLISRANSEQMNETDLGLLLVKRLIDKLGGTFWVESTSSQTNFTVELPQSH